ncbi:MAG: hypothetical protein KF752_02185 [Pirellulaceae bacterium]|nr:hypothetical protein [Pirellulaceae bacterium]
MFRSPGGILATGVRWRVCGIVLVLLVGLSSLLAKPVLAHDPAVAVEVAPSESAPGAPPLQAQPVPDTSDLFRVHNRLFVWVDWQSRKPAQVPRVAAPLRSVRWHDATVADAISVQPEVNHWLLKWPRSAKVPEPGAWIELEFDAPPELLHEVKPIAQMADGSFYLPAHVAETLGAKLRYEPQPHKNTVGYWTNATDRAVWRFELDRPGRFNVAILQGCGAGHGGSRAELSITPSNGSSAAARVEFQVVETGHFQDFRWLQLESIHLGETGVHQLQVRPLEILNGALMDIRAIQLVRLPQ